MPSYTYLRRKQEKQRERQARYSAAGVAARQRKIEQERDDAELVGTVQFSGSMFGGEHVLTCYAADWYSDSKVMIEIDGHASKARTVRGLQRVIARRLTQGGSND